MKRRVWRQGFTAGDNAEGYTLSEIRVRLGSIDATTVPRASIYTATENGLPGTSLYVLANPATVTQRLDQYLYRAGRFDA